LREYRTDTAEPPELDLWWQLRLAQARGAASPPTLTRYEADIYAPVEVYDAGTGALGHHGAHRHHRTDGGQPGRLARS
jgi:cephalosporin-C deacetylase-like acetyl esterase